MSTMKDMIKALASVCLLFFLAPFSLSCTFIVLPFLTQSLLSFHFVKWEFFKMTITCFVLQFTKVPQPSSVLFSAQSNAGDIQKGLSICVVGSSLASGSAPSHQVLSLFPFLPSTPYPLLYLLTPLLLLHLWTHYLVCLPASPPPYLQALQQLCTPPLPHDLHSAACL